MPTCVWKERQSGEARSSLWRSWHTAVDRTGPANHRVDADALVDLLTGNHPTLCGRQHFEELELAPREIGARIRDKRLKQARAKLELSRDGCPGARRPIPPAGGAS